MAARKHTYSIYPPASPGYTDWQHFNHSANGHTCLFSEQQASTGQEEWQRRVALPITPPSSPSIESVLQGDVVLPTHRRGQRSADSSSPPRPSLNTSRHASAARQSYPRLTRDGSHHFSARAALALSDLEEHLRSLSFEATTPKTLAYTSYNRSTPASGSPNTLHAYAFHDQATPLHEALKPSPESARAVSSPVSPSAAKSRIRRKPLPLRLTTSPLTFHGSRTSISPTSTMPLRSPSASPIWTPGRRVTPEPHSYWDSDDEDEYDDDEKTLISRMKNSLHLARRFSNGDKEKEKTSATGRVVSVGSMGRPRRTSGVRDMLMGVVLCGGCGD